LVAEFLLSIEEVARELGVQPDEVLGWINNRQLDPNIVQNINGELRIPAEAVGLHSPTRLGRLEQRAHDAAAHLLLGYAALCRRTVEIGAALALADKTVLGVLSSLLLDMGRSQQSLVGVFQDLFGPGAGVLTFSLGKRTYHSGYHRDHLTPWACLNYALGIGLWRSIRILPADYLQITPEGDLFVIGGPVATPITKHAYEYRGPNDNALRRDHAKAALPLRFYWMADQTSDLVDKQVAIGWRLEDGRAVSSPAMPIIDTRAPAEPKAPIPNRSRPIRGLRRPDGRKVYLPKNNFLIVTRLRNFIAVDPEDPLFEGEDCPSIVLIEGNNGIGTRGFELLSNSNYRPVLKQVARDLNGAREYQLLFELTEIESTKRGAMTYDAFTGMTSEAVEPLNIEISRYKRARDYTLERLSLEHRRRRPHGFLE
jgi:hypothetical protein